jgi:hypothetical protein
MHQHISIQCISLSHLGLFKFPGTTDFVPEFGQVAIKNNSLCFGKLFSQSPQIRLDGFFFLHLEHGPLKQN